MADIPISKEDQKQLQFLDNREYQSKFLLSPDVSGGEDFTHLDKNLAITNLKHNPRLNIDEVAEARAILRGLHVLNNTKHCKDVEEETFVGYKEIEMHNKEKNENRIVQIPVFRKVTVRKSKFPKTYHSLRSEMISMSVTTASRNGHRMQSAITNRLEKTADIIDRTKHTKKWGSSSNKY